MSRTSNAKTPASAIAENGRLDDCHAGERDNDLITETPTLAQAVPLACIKDGGAQMRVEKTSIDTINDYAEEMLNGAVFPPVIVYFDGTDHWLGEGFHRVGAARKIKRETILADVRQGSRRDAIMCGVGANATHGLRRTQADKRRAVEALLTDPEWARWSDRKIAEAAKVDHKTVGKMRKEMSGEIPTGTGHPVGGEIPTKAGNGKPVQSTPAGSLLESVLQSISDDALISECRQRGLTVEATND